MKFAGREILKDFISMIYPRYCFACKKTLVKGEDTLCTTCLLDMPRTNFISQKQNVLLERLSLQMPLQYAMAYYHFKKGNKVQHLLHELKYGNHPEIARTLGTVMGRELLENEYAGLFDIIVPVPLHKSRMRTRGYNQSEEFANGISAVLNVPVSGNFIKRSVKTETQTKKSKLSRWKNVEMVFEMLHTEEVSGKRVLLVDDVVTTGATLEACAQSLRQAGCSQLSIACIAMA